MGKIKIKKYEQLLRIGLYSSGSIFISSVLFDLSLINSVINSIIVLLLSYKVYIYFIREIDEKNRFLEASGFIEQMIYSFIKFPKIREALLDVRDISENRLKAVLNQALYCIDAADDINIFEKALNKIEKEYSCNQIHCLNKYLVKLETEGGQHELFLNLLLRESKEWSCAVLDYRMEVKKKKRNFLFAIAVTVITGVIMIRLVPKDFTFTHFFLYKITITCSLISLYLVYMLIQKKSSSSWLEKYYELPMITVQYYCNIIKNGFPGKKKKIIYFSSFFCLVISTILLFIKIHKLIFISLLFISFILILFPSIKEKQVKKKMTREIEKSYGDWLLTFGMNLQYETVQTALYHSYLYSPNVLKIELQNVLALLTTHPVSIIPYSHFLEKYDLKEIKSSFRMLYPMQNLERDQMFDHLSLMIERNQRISEKSFILQQEDKVGLISLLISIPSIIGMFIILVSIFLLVTNFSAVIERSMEGLSNLL